MISEKQTLASLYEQMYQHMISKDIQKLGALLDDSFVLVHMTGLRQPKPLYLQAIKDGTLNYYSAHHDSISSTIKGDRAELCGQSRVTAAVFGGGKNTWRLQLDISFVRHGESWLMSQCSASTY